ncbi:hypothetical protein KO361_02475 [Candidatus Woesearchaeota archaeon]|nr:hypothetical protein [Candidatus Woesearchaeota archaeon]
MNKKVIVLVLLILSVLATGCMRSPETRCNYDGICEDWETDDCPDCADVLGRGVQIPPSNIDLNNE